MNILELCLTHGLGGLEVYVFRVSQAFSEKHNVRVMTNGKLLRHFRKNSSIQTNDIDCMFRALPLFTAFKVARFIDEHDIDVIHAHWTKDLPLAALAKKLSKKKPALVFTRQMDITREKNDFYHRMQYAQIDLFLTITEQLAERCRKFITAGFNGAIKNLYHGVPEPDHFLSNDEKHSKRAETGIGNDEFVVGIFGRLEKSKGQHLLIEATSLAKEQGIKITALIVGHEMEDGYRDILKEQCKDLGIEEQVFFLDFVDNPQILMQVCDCVALTTYNETFGLVLPEAMRAGIPVIGSNQGGVPEIIEHENTGLLFESMDPKSLCKQINKLYTDTSFRNRLALNGKNKADTVFDNKKHFAQLEKLFQELVS